MGLAVAHRDEKRSERVRIELQRLAAMRRVIAEQEYERERRNGLIGLHLEHPPTDEQGRCEETNRGRRPVNELRA